MTATAGRRWLVAALVLAVAALLASVLAAATLSGNLGDWPARGARSASGAVMMQSSPGYDVGAAMSGETRRATASTRGRPDCAETMPGWND